MANYWAHTLEVVSSSEGQCHKIFQLDHISCILRRRFRKSGSWVLKTKWRFGENYPTKGPWKLSKLILPDIGPAQTLHQPLQWVLNCSWAFPKCSLTCGSLKKTAKIIQAILDYRVHPERVPRLSSNLQGVFSLQDNERRFPAKIGFYTISSWLRIHASGVRGFLRVQGPGNIHLKLQSSMVINL